MNKKVVTIVIVILFLIGGIYALSSKNKNSSSSDGTFETEEGSDNEEVSSPKSIKDLLTAGISQKCTYSYFEGKVSSEGTTYVSGGKVRGDFRTTVDNKSTTGHTIYDGKTSYVWMDGERDGFKMEIDLEDMETGESATTNQQQTVDLNKSLDYDCSLWSAQESVFDPPSDVTFSGFTIPSTNQDNPSDNSQDYCDSCNSLSGDQKAQCLSALNCN
jgi:hypothetical protein